MDFFEAVEKRYSYRGKYKDEPVPDEDLKKIVETGLKAPSGKNAQTTEFVIVNDEETLKKVKDILPERDMSKTAKAFIACIIDKEPEAIYHGYNFQYEDCAAAVENILLAIYAMGYASVWLDGILRLEKKSEMISEVLGLPESKKVQIILPVGIPAEEGPRKETLPFEKRAWFNKYKD